MFGEFVKFLLSAHIFSFCKGAPTIPKVGNIAAGSLLLSAEGQAALAAFSSPQTQPESSAGNPSVPSLIPPVQAPVFTKYSQGINPGAQLPHTDAGQGASLNSAVSQFSGVSNRAVNPDVSAPGDAMAPPLPILQSNFIPSLNPAPVASFNHVNQGAQQGLGNSLDAIRAALEISKHSAILAHHEVPGPSTNLASGDPKPMATEPKAAAKKRLVPLIDVSQLEELPVQQSSRLHSLVEPATELDPLANIPLASFPESLAVMGAQIGEIAHQASKNAAVAASQSAQIQQPVAPASSPAVSVAPAVPEVPTVPAAPSTDPAAPATNPAAPATNPAAPRVSAPQPSVLSAPVAPSGVLPAPNPPSAGPAALPSKSVVGETLAGLTTNVLASNNSPALPAAPLAAPEAAPAAVSVVPSPGLPAAALGEPKIAIPAPAEVPVPLSSSIPVAPAISAAAAPAILSFTNLSDASNNLKNPALPSNMLSVSPVASAVLSVMPSVDGLSSRANIASLPNAVGLRYNVSSNTSISQTFPVNTMLGMSNSTGPKTQPIRNPISQTLDALELDNSYAALVSSSSVGANKPSQNISTSNSQLIQASVFNSNPALVIVDPKSKLTKKGNLPSVDEAPKPVDESSLNLVNRGRLAQKAELRSQILSLLDDLDKAIPEEV